MTTAMRRRRKRRRPVSQLHSDVKMTDNAGAAGPPSLGSLAPKCSFAKRVPYLALTTVIEYAWLY